MAQKFGRILALFTNMSKNQTRPKLAFKCPKKLHTFNNEEKIRTSTKEMVFHFKFDTTPVCNVYISH